ncbi:uncharacterized protein LOC143725555 [Siphateles boraxobius]|uniref:uncharacterized protein LOC143725555 n=1 Tax=Siphateles boraxobius TaxID=180520 RepID=UPI004062801B
MKTIVIIKLAFVSVLVVAGSKIEAIDGQNATISFDIDEVEKADEVKIIFKEDKKEYAVVIAQKPWVYDDPPSPGVTLILGKGCLSVIIQNISISRSGLYKAEVYTGEKVCEVTATLVVNILVVAGSKIEAIDGQNATISFDIDEVEKADEVKIIFKEDKKEYAVVIAQKPWVYDDPP